MAIIEELQIGVVTTLASGVAYALPARACYISYQGTAPTGSNDGSTFALVIATASVVSCAFIKSAAADTIVCLKTM
jgi:hypothetical protein